MAREALAVTVGARAWSGPTDTGDDSVPHVLSVVGTTASGTRGRRGVWLTSAATAANHSSDMKTATKVIASAHEGRPSDS